MQSNPFTYTNSRQMPPFTSPPSLHPKTNPHPGSNACHACKQTWRELQGSFFALFQSFSHTSPSGIPQTNHQSMHKNIVRQICEKPYKFPLRITLSQYCLALPHASWRVPEGCQTSNPVLNNPQSKTCCVGDHGPCVLICEPPAGGDTHVTTGHGGGHGDGPAGASHAMPRGHDENLAGTHSSLATGPIASQEAQPLFEKLHCVFGPLTNLSHFGKWP